MESLIKVRLVDSKGRVMIVQCRPSDTISDLKKKYVENGGNKYIRNPKFKYDGEILEESVMLSDLEIEDYDCITVNETVRGGETGCATKFSDPEKQGPVEIDTVTEGPDYLIVCDGLNLFGNCLHKGCVAYNKEVSHQFGFGTYNAINDPQTDKRPICPMCEDAITPITAGFMNCRYQFIGTKFEKGDIKSVNYKNETHGNKHIHYLKTDSKNMSIWVELEITAKKL